MGSACMRPTGDDDDEAAAHSWKQVCAELLALLMPLVASQQGAWEMRKKGVGAWLDLGGMDPIHRHAHVGWMNSHGMLHNDRHAQVGCWGDDGDHDDDVYAAAFGSRPSVGRARHMHK